MKVNKSFIEKNNRFILGFIIFLAIVIPFTGLLVIREQVTRSLAENNQNAAEQVKADFNLSTLEMISPRGGETIMNNQPFEIKWGSSNVKKVSISYISENKTLGAITRDYTNSGSFTWDVNVDITQATNYKIVILGFDDSGKPVADVTSAYFTIANPSPTPVSSPTPSATPRTN